MAMCDQIVNNYISTYKSFFRNLLGVFKKILIIINVKISKKSRVFKIPHFLSKNSDSLKKRLKRSLNMNVESHFGKRRRDL